MKRAVFLVMYLIVGFSQVAAQCPNGDIIINSQQELDTFIERNKNCTGISGNLVLESNLIVATEGGGEEPRPITDISKLTFLRVIKGNLRITADIAEITNFYNLTQVNGTIEITNSRSLNVISDFNNLEFFGGLIIAFNSNLKSVEAFKNIKRSEGSIEIGDNPKLESIKGFGNLSSVGGELNISKNNNLNFVDSFNRITSIGNDLNFTSNPKLDSIKGFEALRIVGNDFNFENTGKSIEGFDNLRNVDRLFQISASTIEGLPSFNNLEKVGGGFVIENTKLKSLEGFNQLKTIGKIKDQKDAFRLHNNQNLTSVLAFGSLVFADGDFSVTNNPVLNDCTWMCYIIKNGEVSGDIILQNNLLGCSNAASLVQVCDPDFDNDGVSSVVDVDDDNDGILDVDEENGVPNRDTDGDGFPDTIDLDSDGDGCFDVTESLFNDQDSDGFLGEGPVIVDVKGRVISDTSGYTTPVDKDLNSIFDFQEFSTLNGGENATVEYCIGDEPIDLFIMLNGNPDPGGVWSPPLSSGGSIFDPSKDRPGNYKYSHIDNTCGTNSAEVIVKLSSDLNPGKDGFLKTCVESGNKDLFLSLEGNPTRGGEWFPALSSGTSIFDPTKDTEGQYIYQVDSEECGLLSATVKVSLSGVPNAGSNARIEVCEFQDEFSLFDLLGENVDANGFWSDNLGNQSGVFNPRTNSSGKYTYTVSNGTCGEASAVVDVTILRNNEIKNVFVNVRDFSSQNNYIEVLIPTEREYEYSIDGFNYQKSNRFNNLKMGNYTVHVRGVNGCEYYTETVSVKTYPVFFTPNGDGVNDRWSLKELPFKTYRLIIYDRFGRMVAELSHNNPYWNGTRNGKTLPSSNYWFKVIVDNKQVYHGNFSLIRT